MTRAKSRDLVHDGQFAALVANLSGGYRSPAQMAYIVLREAIMTGAFAPGERLPQDALAEAIGVSRTPVRMALLRLESDGIASLHASRGAHVRALTPKQIDEMYQLRVLMECYAVERECREVAPGRLKRLQCLAQKLDVHGQCDEFFDLRIAFYRALYDAERNPLLVEMIDDLRSDVRREYLGIRLPDPRRRHTDLIERIALGDIEGAKLWLSRHLDHIRLGVKELAAERTKTRERTERPPNRNAESLLDTAPQT